MDYKSFCILCCCLLVIIIILSISIIYQRKNEEYYEFTVDKLVSGTISTAKDLKDYSEEKWYELKAFLKKHYKTALQFLTFQNVLTCQKTFSLFLQ